MNMNIDTAIKVLGQQRNFRDTSSAIKLDDAIKLGVSALVRIKTLRQENGAANYPLFGETGDETSPV